jgi:hypothetical protein
VSNTQLTGTKHIAYIKIRADILCGERRILLLCVSGMHIYICIYIHNVVMSDSQPAALISIL